MVLCAFFFRVLAMAHARTPYILCAQVTFLRKNAFEDKEAEDEEDEEYHARQHADIKDRSESHDAVRRDRMEHHGAMALHSHSLTYIHYDK
jgi:hypothetical protein